MPNTQHSVYIASERRIGINALLALYRVRFLLTGLLLSTTLFSGTAAAVQPDIWHQLKKGGYVLLIRHGMVDSASKSTSPDADFEGCEGQYNLTAIGREQVIQLGNVLRKHKIPIGGVLASPRCRTQDTARLALGIFRVFPLLEPLPETDLAERQQRVESLRRVISDHKGTDNLVLITHQPNINALTMEVVDTATIVIVKPDGKGNFNVVQSLPPNAWRMDR